MSDTASQTARRSSLERTLTGVGRIIGALVFGIATSVVITFLGGGATFVGRPVGVAFLALWVVWWLVIAVGRRYGGPSAYDKGQLGIVLLGTVALFALVLLSPWEYANFAGPIPRDGLLAWAGIILFAAGIVLQAAAMWAIRGLYTVRIGVQPDHRLVTGGPYRIVRHPGYLSNLMCMAGIGLALSSIVALVSTVSVVPLILQRIEREEQMLATEFGESHRAYREQTRWRLVPFIY